MDHKRQGTSTQHHSIAHAPKLVAAGKADTSAGIVIVEIAEAMAAQL
jgi:hypothetical protein